MKCFKCGKEACFEMDSFFVDNPPIGLCEDCLKGMSRKITNFLNVRKLLSLDEKTDED